MNISFVSLTVIPISSLMRHISANLATFLVKLVMGVVKMTACHVKEKVILTKEDVHHRALPMRYQNILNYKFFNVETHAC